MNLETQTFNLASDSVPTLVFSGTGKFCAQHTSGTLPLFGDSGLLGSGGTARHNFPTAGSSNFFAEFSAPVEIYAIRRNGTTTDLTVTRWY